MYKSICSVVLMVFVVVIQLMNPQNLDIKSIIESIFFVGGLALVSISLDKFREDEFVESIAEGLDEKAFVFKIENKKEENDGNKKEWVEWPVGY